MFKKFALRIASAHHLNVTTAKRLHLTNHGELQSTFPRNLMHFLNDFCTFGLKFFCIVPNYFLYCDVLYWFIICMTLNCADYGQLLSAQLIFRFFLINERWKISREVQNMIHLKNSPPVSTHFFYLSGATWIPWR